MFPRVDSFVHPPDDTYPLFITAKRYSEPQYPPLDNCSLTLICLHSTSFPKEVWEPTLDSLFRISRDSRSPVQIREAWVIECPNHGSSAVLNEDYFCHPAHSGRFGCRKYGLAVHRFLTSGPFSQLKHPGSLALVGHSLGAVASCFLRVLEPRLKFRLHIIIEPAMTAGSGSAIHFLEFRRRAVVGAYERRDVWPSREEARVAFKRSGWDSRVLDSFLEFGLRDHSGRRDARMSYSGVTLACTRDEEAGMYKDIDGPLDSVPLLKSICKEGPVHAIFGEIADFIPVQTREALCDPTSGCKFASFSIMKDIGHIIPQVAPDRLAHEIQRILSIQVHPKPKL
ncbi:hypothetical protein K488DRAFT_54342 [Vararia minispora EC-137]|uniref:Uncharacterized protein n=1 Tax=Vararia minispora EC-137 TaxID=1314806 RepID=A0ACB8QFM4_9AGAM|nr:hypothetical protein K488DRAFT_54342 [Vararia minispora EC-137]